MLTKAAQEDLLCVAALSATVAAAAGQLRHISSHADVAPYISLAMLGVQALGYDAALVANARMLPVWPMHSYKVYADQLECAVRALTLATLLLTAAERATWKDRSSEG